jgi:putative redox protein
MEALLIGLGGCTAFDVVKILERGRHPVTDCVVEVAAERAASDPKVFTRIRLDYTVTGRRLEDKHVRRAIELSTEKYCSATAMLRATATIEHGYSIVNLADG